MISAARSPQSQIISSNTICATLPDLYVVQPFWLLVCRKNENKCLLHFSLVQCISVYVFFFISQIKSLILCKTSITNSVSFSSQTIHTKLNSSLFFFNKYRLINLITNLNKRQMQLPRHYSIDKEIFNNMTFKIKRCLCARTLKNPKIYFLFSSFIFLYDSVSDIGWKMGAPKG